MQQPEQAKGPNNYAKPWNPALLILGAALIAVAPMAFQGISCGHDLNFHLLSWMEVARAWHSGVWYPHWVHDANYGAGEPRLIFYPPASWMLGAALGSITSWTVAPAVFVLAALSANGLSMYWLAREWLPERSAALAACLYVANPYALFVAYERSAFAELLAGAWIPLIVLFATSRARSIPALGLAVAAVWLTDPPAAVMASYMLAVVALAMMWAERKAWPGWRAAGGMGFGLGLAAFYLVPAAYEEHWVEIKRAALPGLRVKDSFLFGHTGDSFHDQVLRTASWILLIEFAAAAVALWLCRRRRDSGTSIRFVFAALLGLIFLLQFPVSEAIWSRTPELMFIQFPWRWLLVVSVATCLFAGMAADSLREAAPQGWGRKTNAKRKSTMRLRAVGSAAVMVTVAAIVAAASHLFFQPCDDEDAVSAQVAAFQLGNGVEGTDEYTPAGADNSAVQQGLPFLRLLAHAQDDAANSLQTENPPWQAGTGANNIKTITVSNKNAEHWVIHLESKTPGYAILRLMDYPAWQVSLNGSLIPWNSGRNATDLPSRDDGLMTIPVIAGSNEIDVRWRITPDVLLGRAISAVMLLLLTAFAVVVRKRRNRVSEPRAAVI
jgi:hypothetical protein